MISRELRQPFWPQSCLLGPPISSHTSGAGMQSAPFHRLSRKEEEKQQQNLALSASGPPCPSHCLDYFKSFLTDVSVSLLFVPLQSVLSTAVGVILLKVSQTTPCPTSAQNPPVAPFPRIKPKSWQWPASPTIAGHRSQLISSLALPSHPAAFLCLQCIRHPPAPGPLYLFSLPETLFSRHPQHLVLSFLQSLCLNTALSMSLSQPI